MRTRCVSLLIPLILALCGSGASVPAQTAYFADGYHGGIYGHYPTNFTDYIVDTLLANPDWKINLEIEPETWDFAAKITPGPYLKLKELARDQSSGGRIEFINPAYAQSYLWNVSEECVIQQLARGMSKIREHFTNATFTTYSSEEPCFTSALPGILNSFGFQNAVLKNPDTCWGGYTRAFGGELVNWIGPDGTSILTVPRYAIESLKPGSTWETIANANSPDYINAALAAGIKHPIGFCLQDAGWRNGPWLEHVGNYYQPSESTTWRGYFEKVASPEGALDWRLSQEDVLVSLMWGSQVLQRIAQEVRRAENLVVTAEKMATLANIYRNTPWPGTTLDEGWRTLMLSQHHDCWIVPYNLRGSNTWADKVAHWTSDSSRLSMGVISHSVEVLDGTRVDNDAFNIRIFNTLGCGRTNLVVVNLPEGWRSDAVKITDAAGVEMPVQAGLEGAEGQAIFFKASTPSLGFSTYRMEKSVPPSPAHLVSPKDTNDLFTIENDFYRLTLDRSRGGTIRSLIAKKLGGRELVDSANPRRFNEVRGYFFEHGRFLSNSDSPATIDLLENGPLRTRIRISGEIEGNAITQMITLVQGEPLIDFSVRIDWHDHPGIGADYAQHGDFRSEDDRKAFYDDRYKLLATFPLNLARQQIFKDAPFDVTASQLTNTFFENWSAIKNNIILDWVDAYDDGQDLGLTLLTDHTTSYAHDTDHTLGLTLQYAGAGLWGRNYRIDGPTEIHYALLPHEGNWERAGLWNSAKSWNEPLIARVCSSEGGPVEPPQSVLRIEGDGWEIPTARAIEGKIFVRLFNPATTSSMKNLHYSGDVSIVEQVRLNGQVLKKIPFERRKGEVVFKMTLPRFGIGTLRITP